jgi:hypothetical protein
VSKTIIISILLTAFLIVMFALSGIGVINFSVNEILCLLLIVAGIGLAYIGLIDKTDIVVFLGTSLFLVGIMILTNLNFEVKIEGTAYTPIVLLISAVSFLMIYISTPSRKFYILISLLLFISASILFLIQTKFEPGRFIEAILPFLEIYWPAIIIFLLLVILLWREK